VHSLLPTTGLDPSWRAGLHVAAVEGLDFGRDLVFTYGPLGFLAYPGLFFASTATASLAFVLVAQLVLAATVLYGASRQFAPPLALLLAYFALSLPLLPTDSVLLALALWVYFALERPSARYAHVLPPLAGGLAAVALLAKLSSGVVAVAVAALVVWSIRPFGWRSYLAAGGSFAVVFAAFWLASGTSPASLPPWLGGSLEVVSGYAQAMAYEQPGLEWEYFVAASLMWLVATLAVTSFWHWPLLRRAALFVPFALVLVFYFRQGFVRHGGQSAYLFAAVAITLVAVRWRGRARWAAVAGVVVAVVTVLDKFDVGPRQYFNPVANARLALTQVWDVSNPARRDALIERGRADVRAALALDPQALAELEGATVHVDPYETSAVWAHGLDWRPLPVFQAYSAYTAELDDRNARFLASEQAPERVLRENVVRIDGKTQELESPTAFFALLCNYVELRADERWQVLGRTDGRCGAPRLLSSTVALSGEAVPVPEAGPNEVVYARFHLEQGLGQRLKELVFKPDVPTIVYDGEDVHRLVFRTAEGPVVLRTPPTLRFSPSYGGGLDRATVQVNGLTPLVGIEFYAVELEPRTREDLR
jgi:hypothetical protein